MREAFHVGEVARVNDQVGRAAHREACLRQP
jgi:hypothetical protein